MIVAESRAGESLVLFTDGSHEAPADVPVSNGGACRGFGPHDLLEAALATCMVITVRKVAGELSFPLADVRCKVRIDRQTPGAVAFEWGLMMTGSLTAEQTSRLHAAAEACPVAMSLTGSVSIRPTAPTKDADDAGHSGSACPC